MISENYIPACATSAIILSAGKSDRFGIPKCFLSYNESTTFIEKILEVYTDARINRIVIVLNEQISKEAKKLIEPFTKKSEIIIVINEYPEKGRYTSIRQGVDRVVKGSSSFIQNIDNPFTTKLLLENMMKNFIEGCYVFPVCHGMKGHPVLLSARILDHIRKTTNEDTSLRDILNEFQGIKTETDDIRIIANINTVNEYQKYFAHETIC